MPWISVGKGDNSDISAVLAEIQKDSDRAAGIVAAVLVDEGLTTLLKSRFEQNEDFLSEIFRNSGPLGAFSVKITMGFLMGLYSEAARRELERIKDIRNQFAHYTARSFAFERIRDLANSLSLSETVEFHMHAKGSLRVGMEGSLFLGGKPPEDVVTIPVIPEIEPDKLTPRERYMRACQFFSAAFAVLAHLPRPERKVHF